MIKIRAANLLVKIVYRLIVLFISSLILSRSIAFIQTNPLHPQQPNTYYFSFLELIILYFLGTALVYLIWGVPVSLFIDYLWKKIVSRNGLTGNRRQYIIKLIFYIIGGATGGCALALYGDLVLLRTMGLGIIAAAIFYHVLLPFENTRRK